MKFNKEEFKKFRKDFEQALIPVAEKYNLSITAGHISYGSDTFTMKLECSKTDAGDIKQKEFQSLCSLFGFDEGDYMREFKFRGERYALEAFSTRSSKYPCICVNISNQTRMKFMEDTVKQAFGLETAK